MLPKMWFLMEFNTSSLYYRVCMFILITGTRNYTTLPKV